MFKVAFLNYDRLPFSQYWRIAFTSAFLLVFILHVVPQHWVGSTDGIATDSWVYAINLAFHKGKIFGNEIIFTYGPLGWLGTTLSIFVPIVPIIMFRLLLCLAQLLVFYKLFDNLAISNKLVFLVYMVYCGRFYDIDAAMYLSICCLTLLVVYKIKSPVVLVSYGVLCGVLFFVKQNIALVNIVLFWLYNIQLYITEKNKLTLFLEILSPLLFILGLSFFLNIQLISYISTGLELANFYNDAMAFEVLDSRTLKLALVVLLIFIVALLGQVVKDRKLIWRTMMATAIIYVVFKQGFTRADAHQMIFWGAIPVIFLLIWGGDKSDYGLKKNVALLTAMIFAIFCAVVVWKIHPKSILRSQQHIIAVTPIKLPLGIKNKMGHQTVDFFPGEISIAFSNQLNYQPRPIPQSYSVYAASLEAANQAFVESSKAPEYIIFRNGTIDDRHPFWDESRVKSSLLSRYDVADSFHLERSIEGNENGNYLLLQKRKKELAVKQETILDTIIHTNQSIEIPKEGKLLLLKADLNYTMLNKLRRFFFHPRFAYITLYYEDQSTSTYRWIPYVMQSGVIINYSTNTTTEASAVFRRTFSSLKKVDSFRVNSNSKWFRDELRISLESIDLQ